MSAHEALKVKQAVLAGTYAAGTFYNGTETTSTGGIDCLGQDEALIIVSVGPLGASATCDISLVSSATNTSAAAVAITDKDAVAQALAQLVDATDDNTVWVMRVRCKDIKRYLFVKHVQAVQSALLSVVVVFTKSKSYPVSQDKTVITGAKHN